MAASNPALLILNSLGELPPGQTYSISDLVVEYVLDALHGALVVDKGNLYLLAENPKDLEQLYFNLLSVFRKLQQCDEQNVVMLFPSNEVDSDCWVYMQSATECTATPKSDVWTIGKGLELHKEGAEFKILQNGTTTLFGNKIAKEAASFMLSMLNSTVSPALEYKSARRIGFRDAMSESLKVARIANIIAAIAVAVALIGVPMVQHFCVETTVSQPQIDSIVSAIRDLPPTINHANNPR